MNELFLPGSTTTSLQTQCSTPTNLASLNTTPQKLYSPLCTINWSLPSAISKSPASVSSTSLPHSTPLTTAYFFSDCHPGLASLALLYYGSSPTCLPDPSRLKPSATL